MAVKKPTGLKITRSGWKFTLSWVLGEKDGYTGGQTLEYTIKAGSKTTSKKFDIKSGKTSSYAITLRDTDYFPNSGKPKLVSVGFSIKGKMSDGKESAVESKTFAVKVPTAPSLSCEYVGTNASKFTWSASSDNSSASMFTRVELKTAFVKDNSDVSKIGDKDWKNRTGSTGIESKSGNVTITETASAVTGDDSHMRAVRVRSVGPAGASAWVIKSHVYARPYISSIVNASVQEGVGALSMCVHWNHNRSSIRPTDETKIRYHIGTPTNGGKCPSDANFTDVMSITETNDKDSYKVWFRLPESVGLDERMWIQIVQRHDDLYVYSEAFAVSGIGNELKAPTLGSATVSGKNLTVTISNNTTSVEDSKVLVEISTNGGSTFAKVGTMDKSEVTKVFTLSKTAVSYIVRVANVLYVDDKTIMKSEYVDNGSISAPKAPSLSVAYNSQTSAIVTWVNTWAEADSYILSWAEDKDAWTSTDKPKEYTVDEDRDNFIISGLDYEKTYYFAIRGRDTSADIDVLSPWSIPIPFTLGKATTVPSIGLSSQHVLESETVYVSVASTSYDEQTVEVAEVVGDEYNTLTTSTTFSGIVIAHDWAVGTSHDIVARIGAGEWSESVSVEVIPEPSVSITSTSLVDIEEESGEWSHILDMLPLTITATSGAVVQIERAEDYTIARPDDTGENRYAGEVIASGIADDNGSVSFALPDLTGILDDGARYKITATISDGYGHTARDEVDFYVGWAVQPSAVSLGVVIEDTTALIYVGTGSNVESVDIYRLSLGRPQLIAQDVAPGSVYVDPYPAIGEYGYRAVAKSIYGDYIDADNALAWTDAEAGLEDKAVIINMDDTQIYLRYGLTFSHKWAKDFKRTAYMNGSVQGDWNKAVTRDMTISAVVHSSDIDTVSAIRRLAVNPTICHIRTPEGSSFACDIQVSESMEDRTHMSFALDVKEVEVEALDAYIYELEE